MKIIRGYALLGFTTVVTLLGYIHSARAATVGTFDVSLASNVYDYGTTLLQGSFTGSGLGILDSNGTFTMTLPGTISIAPAYQPEFGISSAQATYQDILTGVYADGVFAPTGGSSQFVSCSGPGAQKFCGVAMVVSVIYFTSESGSISEASGGSVSVIGNDPSQIASEAATYTASPVPLPPSVALLGFGLLSLLSAARRRTCLIATERRTP